MRRTTFAAGVLAGMALTLALGVGVFTMTRSAAAGAVQRVGGALLGAWQEPVAPATGRLAHQNAADDASSDATEQESHAQDEEGDATAAETDDPCAGKHGLRGHALGRVFSVQQGPPEVASVEDDSAAAAAGLEAGDRITALDGAEMADGEALAEAIGARAPGDVVTLTLERDGESREVEATLGAHPEDGDKGFLGIGIGGHFEVEMHGMPDLEGKAGEVLPFSLPEDGVWRDGDEARPFMKRFRLHPRPEMHLVPGDLEDLEALAEDGLLAGASVGTVVEDSPAAEAGLEQGDIITGLDGEAVQGAQALVEAITARAPGETVELTVARAGESQPLTLLVTLGERPAQPAAADGAETATGAWLGVAIGTVELRFGDDGVEMEGRSIVPGGHLGEMRESLDRLRDRARELGDETRPGRIFELHPHGSHRAPALQPGGLDDQSL